ncbi:MAG TPA: class I SAM-dependent methyltransferase [Paucimonas sp.]|nr:class I SAM-dependent methyltransferase [Paucimonas sp.]
MTHAVAFFDKQFQRQIGQQDFALNPFETKALAYAKGRMLDFGCGLGNLSMTAARRGSKVVAVDASPAAIASLAARARQENLPLEAIEADAASFGWNGCFDTVASIGLLMFLPCGTARKLVPRLRDATCDGGTAIVNVLVQGTTYLEMFGSDPYCLFDPEEVRAWFDGWKIADFSLDDFAAPGNTTKRFATVIAQKAH